MNAEQDGFGFVARVLIVLGLVTLVVLSIYFLSQLIEVLLLVFAAVLLAAAITGVRGLIQRHTPLSPGWSLATTYLSIAVLVAAMTALILPQAAEQLPKLVQQIPQAVEKIAELIQQTPGAQEAIEEAEENSDGLLGADILGGLLGVFSTTLGAISAVLLIMLIAVYLSLSPALYVDHLLRLLPPSRRPRAAEIFRAQGHALRFWLLGRLVSMVFVGVFTAIGLMLLDVPIALTLGLIAGLATFIPYLGPLIGAVPALLIALLEGPMVVLYVAILYFIVETAESSLIYPLAQRHAVHIAPAYTVIIQIAGGVVAGIPGVILATPLAVVAAVAVQMLYIENVLNERVDVLGSE